MAQIILTGNEIKTALEKFVKEKYGVKTVIVVSTDVPLLTDCKQGDEEYTQTCEFDIIVKKK